MINEQLTDLGITLSSVAPPVADYADCVIVDRTAYVGGHGNARRARTSVGTAELPFDIAVENETIAHVGD